MRVSLELFGIPDEATDTLRRAVYDSYERFIFRNNSKESETTLQIRGGTCPLSGRNYMNVVILSPHAIDLPSLNLFAETIYAAHPLKDDDLVKKNRFVRLEDSPPPNGRGADEEDLDEADLADDELACWVCGRFDGEEYFNHAAGESATLEVAVDPEARVPLCSVCQKILHRSRSIE